MVRDLHRLTPRAQPQSSKRSPRSTPDKPSGARGRPPVISDDDLLEIARQVFLERGIRATTSEVAERAGIAEGTVFRRFRSKDALFRAAMRVDPTRPPPIVEQLADRAGKGDLRGTLLDFAEQMLELGRVALPVLFMSWSNPGGDFAIEKATERSAGFRRGFRAIQDFFEAEVRAGRLGKHDPELLTRVFMGSLHHFCMTEMFLAGAEGRRLTPSQFANGLVDFLLQAAGQRAARTAARRPRSAKV